MSSIQSVGSGFTSRPSTRGRTAVGMREEIEASAREETNRAAATQQQQERTTRKAEETSTVQAERKTEARTESRGRTPGSGVQMSNDMLVWMQSQ